MQSLKKLGRWLVTKTGLLLIAVVLLGSTATLIVATNNPKLSQNTVPASVIASIKPSGVPRLAQTPASKAAEPVRITIPKIAVDTSIVDLGLRPNGELDVPKDYNQVGWYVNSPVPGAIGPAILAGHVDSPTAPAIFARLSELTVGDTVAVSRRDGRTVTFTIKEKQSYPQSQFPTARVYGNIPTPGLRLITCDGLYSEKAGRYEKNLVLYADATS